MNSNEKREEVRRQQFGLAKDHLSKGQILQTSQYETLFDVINFTKFALDYEDEIRFASNDLSKDDLISILNRTFLRHTDELISIIKDDVYYHDKESMHWVHIKGSDKDSFKQFVKNVLGIRCETITICKQASEHIIAGLTSSSRANDIIQFDDCYIENNDLHFGVSDAIRPKYRIDRSIYEYLTSNKEPKYSKEVDELLMHICNQDNDTYERLLDDLSTMFITDPSFLNKLGVFPRLYGPSGSNGKSTLMNLISSTVGSENVGSFKTHQFESYSLADGIDKLLIYDDDEQGSRISDNSSNNIKSFVTGNKVRVRQIREKGFDLEPSTLLVGLSNNMPKSEDKSPGFSRRLDWFEVDHQLVKDNEWFEHLFSEKSYDYLLYHLVKRALQFMRKDRTQLASKSKRMLEVHDSFKKNNSSVLEFIEDYDKEWFINRSLKKAYETYESYCKDNLLTMIGQNNFTKTICAEFDLVKKRLTISNTKDKDDLDLFSDDLPSAYKEKLNGGQVSYYNAAGINISDDEAKEIVNRGRKMCFVNEKRK